MNAFNNLMLKWKLTVGFAIPLALLVIISTIVYFSLNKLLETNTWVNHTYQAIDLGKGISSSLVNMETGFRGFLVVGEEEFLEPFQAGKTDFSDYMRKAQAKVSDNQTQVSRLKKVESIEQRWHSEHTSVAMQFRREVSRGDGSRTSDDISSFIKKGIGKRYMDEMRGILDEFIAAESALIVVRNKEQEDTANNTNQITVFGTIVALLISAFIARLTTSSIAGPIGGLTARLVEVQESNDFSIRLPVESKDETGQAAFAFNNLMQETQNAFDEINTTMEKFAQGDASARIEADLQGDLAKLKNITNELMETVDKQQIVERSASGETSRIKQALDVCDTAVMMADEDLNIIYMNAAVQQMMSGDDGVLHGWRFGP
jgi:methyl-accepting chemotaxis protein